MKRVVRKDTKSYGWSESKGRYIPDDVFGTCQCVMSHDASRTDGAISQCRSSKWDRSNAYCQGCELLHGPDESLKKGWGR